jgi:glycosyltransferase involved in cell wall biosynthesis
VENLKKNLPRFLEQDYPNFEIVIVNDGSTDDTEALLYLFKQQHSNLLFTTIEPDRKFKHDRKLCIAIGIKAAKYDTVLFTEADCSPQNKNWLSAMQESFNDKTEILIGYCRTRRVKGFTNKLIRTYSLFSALFWISAAKKGKPYKGSFKNIGISQSAFFNNKGFANLNSYRKSEETLYLCRNGNAKNVSVTISPNSILSSYQKLTFNQWFNQQATYASLLAMGKRGRGKINTELFSRIICYLTAVFLVYYGTMTMNLIILLPAVLLLFIRIVSQFIIYRKAQNRLQERGIFIFLLFYDILSPILMLCIALARPNLNKLKKIK